MKNRNLLTVVSLVAVLSLAPFSSLLAQATNPSDTEPSRLSGKVVSEEGKPVANAKVMAYHLSTGQLYTSVPTGPNGEYDLSGLPHGYFDLAIETEAGVFAGNQVVNLGPAAKMVVNFTTVEFAAGDPAARSFPGTGGPSSGMARVREKMSSREFWTSAKGVAILTGGGAASLLVIASGSGSDSSPDYCGPEVSPFVPCP